MTHPEILNFARQTILDLEDAAITAADFQCMLPLTMPRLQALEQILEFYILNHNLNLKDEPPY